FLYADPAPTHLSTLSLHDALPISTSPARTTSPWALFNEPLCLYTLKSPSECSKITTKPVSVVHSAKITVPLATAITGLSLGATRSEEHTSELQSRENLVCRLLLEK